MGFAWLADRDEMPTRSFVCLFGLHVNASVYGTSARLPSSCPHTPHPMVRERMDIRTCWTLIARVETAWQPWLAMGALL